MALTPEERRELQELQAYDTELQSRIDGTATSSGRNTSIFGDIGTALKTGLQSVPGALTGIPDTVTGALFNATPVGDITDEIGQAIGFQPSIDKLDNYLEYSPKLAEGTKAFNKAEGFMDSAGALVSNPRVAINLAAESLPPMLAGGAIGRGLMAAKAIASPAVAVSAGEGLIAGGQQMTDLASQPDVDPRTAAVAAAATAAVVGAIGYKGATLAQKMKLANPDLVVAGLGGGAGRAAAVVRPAGQVRGRAVTEAVAPEASRLSRAGELASRVGRGAVVEGVLEEAPQSFAESVIANIALGDDPLEGVGKNVAAGIAAGGIMGGAFNLRGDTKPATGEAPPTRGEITAAAKGAGFNLDTIEGQSAVEKLYEQEGNPVENATAARQAMRDNFVNLATEIITTKGNGVGGDKGTRLIRMAHSDAMDSKEGIDAALTGLPKKQQARIRNSEHYSQVPATAADVEAAKQEAEAAPADETVVDGTAPEAPAQAPEEEVTIEDVGPDLPSFAQPQQGVPEAEQAKIDRLAEVGATLEEDESVRASKETTVDPADVALKEAAAEAAPDGEGGMQVGALRGIASLINGYTLKAAEELRIAKFNKADKQYKPQLTKLKATLPKWYTTKGNTRAATPEAVRTFLDKLPALAAEYQGDNRVMAGLRKRADTLAKKHKTPRLASEVAKLTNWYQLQYRLGDSNTGLSREAKLNLRRTGRIDLDTLFSRLHKKIETYDKKVATVGGDRVSGSLDTRSRAESKKQTAFDDKQAAQADEAKQLILGRTKTSDVNLFGLGNEIAADFKELEAVLERKNLLRAFGMTKRGTTETRKALPGMISGKETSVAARFSTMYSNYRDNDGRIDPRPSRRQVRFVNEAQDKLNKFYSKDGNKIPYTPVTLNGDGTITRPDGQPMSAIEMKIDNKRKTYAKSGSGRQAPVLLLLDTLSKHSMSPVSRMLASRFAKIIEKSNYFRNIDVVLHPEQQSPQGWAGAFKPARGDDEGNITEKASLHLWAEGTRETTVLHEVMHAVTLGITSQWQSDPTSVTKEQARALKSLEILRKDMANRLAGQVKNTGKPLGGKLDGILATLQDPNRGLDEFITYAMTDSELQDWMRTHPAAKGSAIPKTMKNWWQVFTQKLKTLWGVQHIPNQQFINTLDAYAEATGLLLGEISNSADRQTLGLSTFFYEPKTKGKDTPTVEDQGFRADTVDPSKPFTGKTSSEEVTQAVNNDAKVVENIRGIITAAEVKEREAEAAGAAEAGAAEAIAAEKGTTAVRDKSTGAQIGKRDSTSIDRTERAIANAILSFVSGGEHNDYETWANDLLAKYGAKIKEYSAKESYMARTIGRFLSKTIDNFGVPDAYRNMMGAFEGTFRGKFNEAYGDYMTLLSLTASQQQGLLDYLYSMDETALKANIPNKEQHETVIRVAKELNRLLAEAKRLGMVDENDKGKRLGDFINLSGGAFRAVNTVSYSQIRPPSDANNQKIFSATGDGKASRISEDNAISVRGTPVDTTVGKEFYMAADKEGRLYAMEVGADQVIWDDFGVAPMVGANADPLKFRVANPESRSGFTMYRKVTIAERRKIAKAELGKTRFKNSPKARAQAVSGLTRLAQEWGRNIQGRELVDGMVSTNEGIKDVEARWITDEKPTLDGEPLGDAKIINITKGGEAKRSSALRTRLRVPGSWAFIEDDAENRARFGAMAGKYVAGPVYTSMVDYYDTTPLVNSATFRTALTLWKKGKTVFSPVAHVNNISGNVVLAYYYDLPAENIFKAFKIVAHSLRSEAGKKSHPLKPDEQALLQEMDDQGIRLAQAKTADYDVAAEEDFADWVEGVAGGTPSLINIFTKLETASSKASDLYSNQDNIFRLATYMTYIQDHAGSIGASGDVGVDIKSAAALAAERAFVDYRIHAPWIKNARETVLPFIAWPYRMFPLLMKVLITKPWKAANTMGAITALNAAAYAALGADADEEDKDRALMPEWYQQGISWMPWVPSSIRLPFGSEENAYFWNVNRAITLADMDQMGGSGVPSMIMPGGPAAILAYAMAGYDPFTGKELSNGTADLSGFLESRAAYIARGLAPGAATSIVTAVKHTGEVGPLGYDHSFWVDAAKVLGISSFQINKPEAAFYKDIERQGATREFNAEMGRVWRRELRQKNPDFGRAADDQIELQRRLTLRLQKLSET